MEMPSFSYLQELIEWLKGIIDAIIDALAGLTENYKDYAPVEMPKFE